MIAQERREMREMEEMLGGLGGGKERSLGGLEECRARLEMLLSRGGLEGLLPARRN